MKLTSETLVNQWNEGHAPEFKIDPADLDWNLTAQDVQPYRLDVCDGVPVLYADGKRPRLALWGAIPSGGEEKFVAALKVSAIGGDEFHFLPGVPDTDKNLIAALQAAGYQGAEECDLEIDVHNSAVAQLIDGSQSAHLVTAKSPGDLEALDLFLKTEFPGRWHREFQFWRSREDTRCAWWLMLRDDQQVVGFSRVALQPAAGDWKPGALRLGASCDSCLGPIGVAKNQRGKGTGTKLLAQALASLKARGGRRVCIDWTDALNYYKPLNFKILRRFWTAKPL